MGHVNTLRTSSGVRFGWYVQDEPEPLKSKWGPEIIPEEDVKIDTSKSVRQYTLDGAFIREYPSAGAAARAVGAQPCNISRACRGLAKTSCGYIFKYADGMPPGPLKRTDTQKAYSAKRNLLVEQLDMDGNVIATYTSQREAVKAIGGNAASMSLVLSGSMVTYKGFRWRKTYRT